MGAPTLASYIRCNYIYCCCPVSWCVTLNFHEWVEDLSLNRSLLSGVIWKSERSLRFVSFFIEIERERREGGEGGWGLTSL